jgi:hypothetical protein
MKRLFLLSAIPLMFVVLAACGDPMTAAQYVAANGTLAVTAQQDQYVRDARATQDAREATIAANAQVIAATAGAATLEAMERNVTATAIATRAEATAAAMATIDRATAQARETEIAYAPTQTEQARLDASATVAARQTVEAATAIAQIHAAATNTQVAAAQFTATAAVVQTQTAILLEAEAADAQRQRIENAAITVLLIVGTCVVIYLIFILVRTYNRNTAKAGSVIAYGPNGNPLILADNGKKGQTIINPLINTSAITTIDGQGQVAANELPELMRAQAMLGALAVLYQQAQHSPFKPVAGVPATYDRWKVGPVEHETQRDGLPAPLVRPRLAAPDLPTSQMAQAAEETAALPLPAWSMFTNFEWARQELLIGVGPNGVPLTLNPEGDPHMLVAGTSGSGKTRHGLTVLAAGALRLGWHVIVLNRAGADFGAFAGHPAAHLFDAPEAPLGWLTAAAQEVDRRNTLLREANVSTWGRLAHAAPRVLLVVDELVALVQSADAPAMRAMWSAVAHITSAGRKCGMHLAFATTDPTYKTLGRQGLVARDNCARVAFRLRSQQVVMPGEALELGPRRFLALTSAANAPIPGAAFAPTDDDLRALVQHLPTDTPTPEFIAAPKGATPMELPPASVRPVAIKPPAAATDLDRVRAALQAEPGLSKRRLAEMVFGRTYAGSYAVKLDSLLAQLGATTTATTAVFAAAGAREVVVAE